jgi:hypothetical protein
VQQSAAGILQLRNQMQQLAAFKNSMMQVGAGAGLTVSCVHHVNYFSQNLAVCLISWKEAAAIKRLDAGGRAGCSFCGLWVSSLYACARSDFSVPCHVLLLLCRL